MRITRKLTCCLLFLVTEEVFLKTYHQQQLQNASQMGTQIGGPDWHLFDVFDVPNPGWAPGRPRTGSKAQKPTKMEPPRRISEDF